MLVAKDLYKSYFDGGRKLDVIRGINLEINKGEFICIVGSSGVGKTTLLHILGGLDKPTKGNVLIDRVSIYKINDKYRAKIRRKKIGFVFQFYHLLPELNVLENVVLPAFINSESKHNNLEFKKRAIELLGIVNLKDRLKHKPSQLSGGEQQRVAIARALINQPELLLCDEPTGNLDSKLSQIVLQLILKLNKEQKQTILIVTHDEGLAKVAEKVLYINDGRIM